MSRELPYTGDSTGGVTTANLKFPVAVFEADRSMDNYCDYPTDKPAKSSRVYRLLLMKTSRSTRESRARRLSTAPPR